MDELNYHQARKNLKNMSRYNLCRYGRALEDINVYEGKTVLRHINLIDKLNLVDEEFQSRRKTICGRLLTDIMELFFG